MNIKDQQFVLHILRNPHGWSDDVVRDVRQKAANELERLYGIVGAIEYTSNRLMEILNDHQP